MKFSHFAVCSSPAVRAILHYNKQVSWHMHMRVHQLTHHQHAHGWNHIAADEITLHMLQSSHALLCMHSTHAAVHDLVAATSMYKS